MKTQSKPSRGWRNNNPLNIRYDRNNAWQGQTGQDSEGFCKFNNLVNGTRAAFALLRSYKSRYHCVTIRDIITRWAPPSENHTDTYIEFVCKHLMMSPEDPIVYNQESGRLLVKAMAVYESKMFLDNDILSAAQHQVF